MSYLKYEDASKLINKAVISYVKRMIGEKTILQSQCPHFNDIPLKCWDSLNVLTFISYEDLQLLGVSGLSLSDSVVIAKLAASTIRKTV